MRTIQGILAACALLALTAPPAAAERHDAPAECNPASDPATRVVNITDSQGGSYQQVLASCRYVTTLGGPGAIDVTTGESHAGTGGIDPFPTPDEKFIVHPSPLRFYNTDDVINRGPTAQPVYTDSAHQGWYQSVGQVSSSPNQAVYRVLTAEGVGAIRDYRVTFDQNHKPIRFEPVQAAPVQLCPELRSQSLNWSLPIISKNGSEFSIVDNNTQTTKIFSFNSTTGACTLVEDLGIQTGKTNFSFDGRKIAFHANSFKLAGMDTTSANTHAYVYDRDAKTITPLTSDIRGSSAVYPGFCRDGTVVYQRRVTDASGNASMSYVMVDPTKVTSYAMGQNVPAQLSGCYRDKDQYNLSLMALGALWQQICSTTGQMTRNGGQSILLALSLDPSGCAQMVRDFYNANFADRTAGSASVNSASASSLRELGMQQLLAACPRGTSTAATTIGNATSTHATVPQVIQDRCVSCHRQGGSHYIPFDNIDALSGTAPHSPKSQQPSLAKEIMRRLTLSGADVGARMPSGDDALSPAEQDQIKGYLERRPAPAPSSAGH